MGCAVYTQDLVLMLATANSASYTLGERSSDRPEKCQLRIEKCQFRTEKCTCTVGAEHVSLLAAACLGNADANGTACR